MPYASSINYNAYKRRSRKARREKLLMEMGGKCAECGETDLTKLEFDHKNGDRDYECNKLSARQRLRLYAEEYKEGRIQLLCRSCNGFRNQYYHNNAGKYKKGEPF